jgi:hypothetical protein
LRVAVFVANASGASARLAALDLLHHFRNAELLLALAPSLDAKLQRRSEVAHLLDRGLANGELLSRAVLGLICEQLVSGIVENNKQRLA